MLAPDETLEAWRTQLDGLVADYLETALRRGRPVTVVLRINEHGLVLPAKISVEVEAAQRMDRQRA